MAALAQVARESGPVGALVECKARMCQCSRSDDWSILILRLDMLEQESILPNEGNDVYALAECQEWKGQLIWGVACVGCRHWLTAVGAGELQ